MYALNYLKFKFLTTWRRNKERKDQNLVYGTDNRKFDFYHF